MLQALAAPKEFNKTTFLKKIKAEEAKLAEVDKSNDEAAKREAVDAKLELVSFKQAFDSSKDATLDASAQERHRRQVNLCLRKWFFKEVLQARRRAVRNYRLTPVFKVLTYDDPAKAQRVHTNTELVKRAMVRQYASDAAAQGVSPHEAVFRAYDVDGDGKMDASELRDLIQSLCPHQLEDPRRRLQTNPQTGAVTEVTDPSAVSPEKEIIIAAAAGEDKGELSWNEFNAAFSADDGEGQDLARAGEAMLGLLGRPHGAMRTAAASRDGAAMLDAGGTAGSDAMMMAQRGNTPSSSDSEIDRAAEVVAAIGPPAADLSSLALDLNFFHGLPKHHMIGNQKLIGKLRITKTGESYGGTIAGGARVSSGSEIGRSTVLPQGIAITSGAYYYEVVRAATSVPSTTIATFL